MHFDFKPEIIFKMKKGRYYVVGVMSGTSLDGLDLALIEFFLNRDKWEYRYLATTTKAYSVSWQEKLSKARFLDSEPLMELDDDYTNFLADQILLFMKENTEYSIDLVSSHGHTVHHQPEQGITQQIGNLAHLAAKLKKTVVCDFRVQDVALGGQGAPLVPGGEFYLLSDYTACVNLGGFANISLYEAERLVAFDVAAANLVFNAYAQKKSQTYDSGGIMASEGRLISSLLVKLNALPYYRMPYPKITWS